MISLQFNFNKELTTFINPITIIEANDIDQVVPMLKQVQKAIENGYLCCGVSFL